MEVSGDVEEWLADRMSESLAPGTDRAYRSHWSFWAYWCRMRQRPLFLTGTAEAERSVRCARVAVGGFETREATRMAIFPGKRNTS